MKIFLKKLFCIFLAFAVICITIVNSLSVNAAKTIEKDNNPLGVVLYTLNSSEYYLEINEDENRGYLIELNNGQEEIVGTCSVIIQSEEEHSIPSEYIDFNNTSSLGSIVIILTDSETGKGYVQNVNGELANLFVVNEKVIVSN